MAMEQYNYIVCGDLYKDWHRVHGEQFVCRQGTLLQRVVVFTAQGDLYRTTQLEQFKNVDFSFGSSRECQFVEDSVNAVRE